MNYSDFVTSFGDYLAPAIEVQYLAHEFQNPRQTIDTVAEMTTEFKERALQVPQYVTNEEWKKTRYHDMLRDGIGEFVNVSRCKTLEEMIDRAWEREIELEL